MEKCQWLQRAWETLLRFLRRTQDAPPPRDETERKLFDCAIRTRIYIEEMRKLKTARAELLEKASDLPPGDLSRAMYESQIASLDSRMDVKMAEFAQLNHQLRNIEGVKALEEHEQFLNAMRQLDPAQMAQLASLQQTLSDAEDGLTERQVLTRETLLCARRQMSDAVWADEDTRAASDIAEMWTAKTRVRAAEAEAAARADRQEARGMETRNAAARSAEL